MHLVIYGSEESGEVTINADGVRVRMRKNKDGAWCPVEGSDNRLTEVRRSCYVNLGAVLTLIGSKAVES